jgi:hypothetical protein
MVADNYFNRAGLKFIDREAIGWEIVYIFEVVDQIKFCLAILKHGIQFTEIN